MTVAIAGATGLVGTRLTEQLMGQEGARVRVLTRDVDRARRQLGAIEGLEYAAADDWEEAIAGCTGVVNLAGEPISTRWGPKVKQEIYDSRVATTRRLAAAINAVPKQERPSVFVSSSAVGYYGTSETAEFDESSGLGDDYLARVCEDWEAAAQEADTRVVIVRNGIVLSKRGGALAKMIPIFALYGGGPLGSGQQWMSWIHIDDLARLYVAALRDDKYAGVLNGTAPEPVRMAALCQSLGAAMSRPSWLPVPEFALQGLLGEGAKVVAEGQRVLPAAPRRRGFRFEFDTVDAAMADLFA